MYDTSLGSSFQRLAGNALYGFRAPVGTYIGKDLRGAGEQVAEQHGYTVQAVIFGG